MNKTELIAAIAEQKGLTKTAVSDVINALEDTIAEKLKSGEAVTILGFGTFTAKAREARTGRNPSTGEPIQIAASTGIHFKPGKALKDAVN